MWLLSVAKSIKRVSIVTVDDVEARQYISELNKKSAVLCTQVHEMFLAAGCNSYVKTIYIGYDIDGEMVAAL